jgi:hypothetical protein
MITDGADRPNELRVISHRLTGFVSSFCRWVIRCVAHCGHQMASGRLCLPHLFGVALNGSPGLSNKKKRPQFAATFVNGPLQGTTLIGCCLPAIEREAVHSAMSSAFDYFTLNDVGRASNSPDLTNVSS